MVTVCFYRFVLFYVSHPTVIAALLLLIFLSTILPVSFLSQNLTGIVELTSLGMTSLVVAGCH